MTENRRQMTESRRQKADDRKQTTDDRRQKTESRRQKAEKLTVFSVFYHLFSDLRIYNGKLRTTKSPTRIY